MTRRLVFPLALISAISISPIADADEPAALRAGAAAIDIAPTKFPVIVNGGFLKNEATKLADPIHAKALVLDNGATRLAFVVVDTCMMPRDLIDGAKARIHEQIGLPTDRILVSATHTHSAPASMGCLGCPVDPTYAAFLPGKIVEAVVQAASKLQPAKVGWTSVDDYEHVYCRRWIYKPDAMLTDPFGRKSVRANMHPGYQNPNTIGPAGPVDPALTLLSVRTLDDKPLAVYANYSMHYYGTQPVSADYFGRFNRHIAEDLKAGPEFVSMMSQGTSGDLMWLDFSGPSNDRGIDAYARGVASSALAALERITYHTHAPLGMVETTLSLSRRIPDSERLAWAHDLARTIPNDTPRNLPEVYAREALYLAADPIRELKIQAARVGDLGITALPNEVFGITGLKIKIHSPLPITMNVELANGAEGYIPPPEQHHLGGYTTWPARTAALEVGAEPRIVATALDLLHKVAPDAQPPASPASTAYVDAVRSLKPIAYWPLDELSGTIALDASGTGQSAVYEPGIAFALPGPHAPGLSLDDSEPLAPGLLAPKRHPAVRPFNRAVQVAGGRVRTVLPDLGDRFTTAFWFWNGLATDSRPITAYLVSRGPDHHEGALGDHLGLGGTSPDTKPGVLFVTSGNATGHVASGRTPIERRGWSFVAYIRDGNRVRVYLNGASDPEIDTELPLDTGTLGSPFFLGGRSDGFAGLEGKLDEVALFDRPLTPDEIATLHRAAGPLTRHPGEHRFGKIDP